MLIARFLHFLAQGHTFIVLSFYMLYGLLAIGVVNYTRKIKAFDGRIHQKLISDVYQLISDELGFLRDGKLVSIFQEREFFA